MTRRWMTMVGRTLREQAGLPSSLPEATGKEPTAPAAEALPPSPSSRGKIGGWRSRGGPRRVAAKLAKGLPS